ncbi:hypothetical protein QZH41_019358 [Actinostola sp. cb2023]|nr:hypothetical protein QZH41_019358 [Actinostola sp. cb2023]
MDKNPGYLPKFMTGYNGPRSSTSRAFQALVRGIGEAKSKYEEDRIIKEEFAVLTEKLGQPSSSKQMREYLVRLIYCEMLGVDASAFHIHAINFAQQRNLHDKRVGYLSLSIFLHENHSLILLLINTLQRDLTSTNVLEMCYALSAVNKLINAEMIPTILQQVLALLDSKRDIVRKKAVMALHTIYKKSPSLVPDINQRAIKALNDYDFSVSAASLHLLYDLIMVGCLGNQDCTVKYEISTYMYVFFQVDPAPYKKLVPTFVALLMKVISGKLHQDFDFHKIPAPWAQIKLLRILSLLGAYDLNTSKQMSEVLVKTLSSLNTSTLISFAVAYECTRTIATIYPDKKLRKYVTKCVGLFLVAKSNDIKYLGLNALTSLIDVNASFATEPSYQRIVINCLDDPDETLKRKNRLGCQGNRTSRKISFYLLIILKYAPDNSWYILTMNEVLELGGDLVREDVAHNLMRLIAEGNDDEEAEEELRRFAVVSYLDLLEKPVLPDILVQVICWILGEYSYVASDIESESVTEKLSSLLERNYSGL